MEFPSVYQPFSNNSINGPAWSRLGGSNASNDFHHQMGSYYDSHGGVGSHANSSGSYDDFYMYNMSMLDGGPPECLNMNEHNVSYLNVSCETIL
jgi:hypothetical protein